VQTTVVRDAAADRTILDHAFVLGLAGVFLVNAIAAVVDPTGFDALVAASPLGRWTGVAGAGWVIPVIAVNDLAIGAGLVATSARPLQHLRRPVLAWAGCWLLLVTLLKLTALL
jgi:hypothetical protein